MIRRERHQERFCSKPSPPDGWSTAEVYQHLTLLVFRLLGDWNHAGALLPLLPGF